MYHGEVVLGNEEAEGQGVVGARYRVGGKQKSVMFRGTAREADRQLAALRLKYEGGGGPRTSLSSFFWGVFVPECERRLEARRSPETSRWRSPRTRAT